MSKNLPGFVRIGNGRHTMEMMLIHLLQFMIGSLSHIGDRSIMIHRNEIPSLFHDFAISSNSFQVFGRALIL